MIYLSGVTNDRDEPALIAAGIGLMCQPYSGYAKRVLRYPAWAADNGAFADTWDEDKWINWLGRIERKNCLFAVAPDVYPDAVASLERSLSFFPIIREMGFPVAFVAQDGAEDLDLPWDEFDCLFVGGERTPNPLHEWKTSRKAERLVRMARDKGKWAHMGRVNSLDRLRRAHAMGCQSVDGTFLKYRRRKAKADLAGDFAARGADELDEWTWKIDTDAPPPSGETPALTVHRSAVEAIRARRCANIELRDRLFVS